MLKRLPAIIIVLLLSWQAAAQQSPQYSLYLLNPFAQNPAYAGMENTLIATGVYRSQWVNLPGAPVTQVFNAHMPLSIINSGIGVQLENDAIGASQRTAVSLAYNYQLTLNRKSVLSLGLSGGLVQQAIDGALLRTPDGQYNPDQNIIIHNDNTLPTGNVTTSVSTFSAGAFFQTERLELGLGIINLAEPTADFTSLSLQMRRTYYLTGAYNLDLFRTLTMTPGFQIKSDIVQTQAELSLMFDFNDKFMLGTSFRGFNAVSQDAAVVFAGFRLNENWTIAYGYDITLSGLNTVSNGSHEVLLKYDLGRPVGAGVPPPVIYNPRY